MRLLDLYCCAGGAGMGWHKAGFEVVGVDKRNHVHYPFCLHQGDALDVLRRLLQGEKIKFYKWPNTVYYGLEDFDAAGASPPCQASSALTQGTNQHLEYQNLIPQTRDLLDQTGLPYVIENVERAPVRPDLNLCGEMFGLRVIRHRLFEVSGFVAPQPEHIPHRGKVQGYRGKVYKDGYYFGVHGAGGGKGTVKEWQDAMGIHWTKARVELAEAIPPAYTEYIGGHLMSHLEGLAA